MVVVFWCAALLVVYVYAGYPCLVGVWAQLADRAPRRVPFGGGRWPSVSVILAVRNEARRLNARVRNLLEQDYPGACEILVVSDGSMDAPGAVLAPFGDAVRLIELPPGGKPLALNAGVMAAHGDILVFADARQRYSPDAITQLVLNFADPAVGGASGELVLDGLEGIEGGEGIEGDTEGIAEGVGLYWRYEKWLRRNESRVWSVLGATGAIYALRRELWQPLPASTLLDDVLAPMRAVLAGKRIVFEERALAYDRPSTDAAAESRRKTRTLAGNYQILGHEPRLLLPVANPVWLQYVSHKLGRLVVPWALLALLASSIALTPRHVFYAAALGLQLVFYGFAMAGAMLHARERLSRIAFTFVVMNYSAIAGLAALRRGREVWR